MAKLTIDAERCKGCGLCVANCPKKLLRIANCALICPDCVITVER